MLLCCILAMGFLPPFPPHLLNTTATFRLLSRRYAEFQSNMKIPSHAENPGRSEGDCEEDTAGFLEDLPGQGRN